MINSRPYSPQTNGKLERLYRTIGNGSSNLPPGPQTNGKLERLYRTIGEQIGHHGSLREYLDHYSKKQKFMRSNVQSREQTLGKHLTNL